MEKVSLQELIGGALQEKFEKSFEKVVENLQNPETSFKAARDITIKMKFVQNETRDDVKCSITVAEKLAPQQSMMTSFAIGKDLKTGELYAEEYGKQIKGQMSISDYQKEAVQVVEGDLVDTATGEVLEEQVETRYTNNVVDLRKTV